MPISDIFGGGDVIDENEAKDLGLHVRQCERRFRALSSKLNIVLLVLLLYALGAPEGIRAMILRAMMGN